MAGRPNRVLQSPTLEAERLLENLPDVVFRIDRDLRYVFVSGAIKKWTGIAAAAYLGKTIREMNAEAVVCDVLESAASRVLARGTPETLQYSSRARTYRCRLSPERDDAGQISSLIGITDDVTDASRASDELRAREQWFRGIIDSIPHMIWVATPDGANEFNNRRLEDYTGMSSRELRGNGWVQAIHPLDAAAAFQCWSKAQASGQPFEITERIRRHDGEYRWFVARGAPVRDETGAIVRWIGTWSDIHGRVMAEEALKASERLYRAIGESIDFGVWVCAPDGRNTYASDSFLKLVGMTQQECSDFGWGRVLHPDDADRTLAAWQECVRAGGNWDIEHRFLGVDGEWHPVLARGVPVKNDAGEIVCWAGINLDISKLKAAEQRLLDADRQKDEFLALLSHELRNPLAAIQNAHVVLERANPVSEQASRAKAVIGRQARQLTRLVDDLLEVTRISRGKMNLKAAEVDFVDLVRKTVEDFRPSYSKQQIEVRLREPREPVMVVGDQARLAQVVGNLLQNAAKFSEEGGHVDVSIKREGEMAVLSVKDDGVGVAPEMLPVLFQPFVQAERTLDRSRGGLGLGLFLVKGIAELHGGSVDARSDGIGKGATFVVRLPLARGAAPISSEKNGARMNTPRRVLVIEDNEDSAETLRDLLEIAGHDVFVARDGLEGVAMAAMRAPDVILCDIGLPVVDGYEVARQLRASRTKAMLVAVSGYAAPEDVNRARQAGFDRHLAKPVDAETLNALIASAPEVS